MSSANANTADLNATFCATVVDEWVRQGVSHAVVAPGSRSAPMALALLHHPSVHVDVVVDERGAAFRALGLGRVLDCPAVLLCTSGTAAAHLFPAIIEASHSRIPMIVCTADRPPELHETGAGQTIDQQHLYGRVVRWFCSPGPPDTERPEFWRSIAARCVTESRGMGTHAPGPVHCNVAFREPLVGTGRALGRQGPLTVAVAGQPAPVSIDAVAEVVSAVARGVIVAGWGCGVSYETLEALSLATGWPVLADAISNVRSGGCAVSTYEAIVRDPDAAVAYRPDALIRFGAPLTSKITTQWLDNSVRQIVVDSHNAWLDPLRAAAIRVVGPDEAIALALVATLGAAPNNPWSTTWRLADERARTEINKVIDSRDDLNGALVARDLFASIPTGAHLLVASSMAVRDLEWCAEVRRDVRVHANRGANGIDGLIATAVGIAQGSGAPTYVLLGDLAFLHDVGSLLGIAELSIDLTIVVVDNRGGGIFSFLPQADHCDRDEFETLFGTPQSVDLVAVAEGFGLNAHRVATPQAFRDALGTVEGVGVLIATTIDRSEEVVRHRAMWESVRRCNLATLFGDH